MILNVLMNDEIKSAMFFHQPFFSGMFQIVHCQTASILCIYHTAADKRVKWRFL